MAWLTKSRFLSGRQCHKRLWFEIHEPLEEAPKDNRDFQDDIVLMNGRAVDRVAQALNPGVVISRDKGLPAAIAETTRVLQSGRVSLLYQPAFRSGDFTVVADALRRSGKNFQLVEVKASTSVKEEHIPDAAFQTMVLRASQVPVNRVFIGHVDKTFVLERTGNYQGLLSEEDVTADVQSMLPGVADTGAHLLAVMAARKAPKVEMGAHCITPYECPFMGRCGGEGVSPEYPMELLPRGGKIVQALEDEGYRDLMQVPAERLKSKTHRRIYQATVSGIPFFDASATADLRTCTYPMAYLDFETIGLAVPEIIGTSPYQQVPFQWSLHVEESASSYQHAEFLGIESFGNFSALVRALIAAMPPVGPVFAYNASFEEARLKELAVAVPDQAVQLLDIADRLVDLLPITRAAYYHRDMQGSWSIKVVLPTIAPELGYERLGTVREGDEAQLAFMELRSGTTSVARRKELTRDLLAYCERDTWAMVVLRRFLCGEAFDVVGERGQVPPLPVQLVSAR